MRIYSKQLREIAWTSFKVAKIYPSYRQAFNPTTKQQETFIMKDGKWFEKFWQDGKANLKEGKPDFKFHKKVYDVEFELSTPKQLKIKDKLETTSVITTTISSWLLGEMMKATVAFGQSIPQKNGRDAFDWEEEYLDKFVGEFLVFAVTGEGIWTKYTFKSALPFVQTEQTEQPQTTQPKQTDLDELF